MSDVEIDRIRAMIAVRPRPPEVVERRKRLDAMGAQWPLPAGVVVEAVDAGGVKAEWTQTPDAGDGRVVLYLHGGAYSAGSIASHRAMVAHAGVCARARTFALDYRLAPEHPYPAALRDVLTAYEYLLAAGFASERIVIAGDSAGSGLALAAMISLRDAGRPLPAAAWCISPWVDLAMTGGSMASKAAVDPLIQKQYLHETAALYLNGADPRAPLVSPLYADLRGLPPLLVQVGAAETLLDDALRLATAAAHADVAVTLEVYPEMIHVWTLFFSELQAGRRALEAAGNFIARLTPPRSYSASRSSTI